MNGTATPGTQTVVVVVVVFFTLTDRASTIPSNLRGCQSGTWSAGQKEVRGTFIKRTKKNYKEKGTRITKYTCQKKIKKIDEGHSRERVWHRVSRESSYTLPDRNHAPKRVASTAFRSLRVSVFTNGTIDVA